MYADTASSALLYTYEPAASPIPYLAQSAPAPYRPDIGSLFLRSSHAEPPTDRSISPPRMTAAEVSDAGCLVITPTVPSSRSAPRSVRSGTATMYTLSPGLTAVGTNLPEPPSP